MSPNSNSILSLQRRSALLMLLAFSLFAAAPHRAAAATIGILVFDGFLTSDVTAPVEVFGAASKKAWFSKYDVALIATTRATAVKSEEGLTVMANASIYDDLALDALIVPSAYAMKHVLTDPQVLAYLKKTANRGAWMASNCSGASLLAEAGLLQGKRATTWAGGEAQLAREYPEVKVVFDQNVVTDGRIITSNGGPVSYQAAFALLEQLSSAKYAQEIAEHIQFTRLAAAFRQ